MAHTRLAAAAALLLLGCNQSPGDVPGPGDGPAPGDGGSDAGSCPPMGARPSARYGHDAVLAPGKILVYGGDTGPFDPMGAAPSAYVDELWRYDVACSTWDQLTPPATPGKRGLYAAAVDSKRNRVLIFGGRSGATSADYQLHADVWAYDLAGNAWKQLAPTATAGSPKPRQSHRAVYDASADRVILFGGNGGKLFGAAPLGDTWELSFAGSDDGAWTQRMGAGPSARQDMATVLDPGRRAWVLFGGAASFVSYSDETWIFDLASSGWKKVTVAAGTRPSRRFQSKLTFDGARDRVVMFGGHDDGPIGLLNETWSFKFAADNLSGAWTNVIAGDTALQSIAAVDRTSPERRNKHSFVGIPGGAWLFGGITDCNPIDDVWRYDYAADQWANPWKAQVGQTCYRRATANQMCPSDCGQPL